MRLFVIRGFGFHRDSSGEKIDFARVHDVLIAPAMGRCGPTGGTNTDTFPVLRRQESCTPLLGDSLTTFSATDVFPQCPLGSPWPVPPAQSWPGFIYRKFHDSGVKSCP